MPLLAKNIVLTTGYVPVAAVSQLRTGTLLAAADNAGVAYVLGDDGVTDVPIPKGVPFPFVGLDLANVRLKGTAADVVILIGAGSDPTARLV